MIKKIILNKALASLLIIPLLKLHNFLYKLISSYAVILNDGIHPKHDILKYKEWFYKKIDQNCVVMDIGCNIGSLPLMLSKKAKFVYGIEIVEKHILRAKKQVQKENIEFICADATTFDYSNIQAVDYVTLSNVLEHIENRIDFLKKIINNMNWNSKKKVFLIRVPMIDRDWITMYKKQNNVEYRLDLTHFTEYTFKQFKEEINSSGLEIENYDIKFGEIYAVCKVKNEII